MRKIITILIIGNIFSSCGNCKEDIRVREKIERQIETIQLRHDYTTGKSTHYQSADEMFKSLYYLGLLTGYMADTPLNYRQTYTNSVIMNNDFKIWRDWYEENKCGLTLEEADIIVKSHDSIK